jgi:ribosomal protein S18 acetylase RimI-like enzyme
MATPADAELIRTLGIKTFRDTFAAQNTEEDMRLYLEKSFSPEQVASELRDPSSFFFLVFDGDQPVGYAKMRTGERPDGLDSAHAIEIERIYSVKEYIGRQVGKALIETCIAYARNQNHDTIWLGVWEHNPRAIAFYEKWGFEKFGVHDFVLGTDPQTDFLMKKKLLNNA